jgi:hypothetical protein
LTAGIRLRLYAMVLCMVALPASLNREVHANGPEYSSTLADILALPDTDVVPALIHAIRKDPLFFDDDWKHQGYELLVSMDGSKYKAGVRQFVAGMHDPAVSCICLYAISTAPKTWHRMVVPGLKKYLDKLLQGNAPPCNDISSLFDAISHFGRHSSSMASSFEEIVEDTLTLPVIRGMAARVLIHVSGVVNHVKVTERLMAKDTVAARLMLNILLLEGEKTRWGFLEKSAARKEVSKLLVSQLLIAKDRAAMERITIGALLIESIARYHPRYAVPFVGPWVSALEHVQEHNRYIAVRVSAMTRIKEAKQLLAFAGRN